MFGNDPKRVEAIEANVEWLSQAAVLIVSSLARLFRLKLPSVPPNVAEVQRAV
jgi:hypothetical protein